MNLTQGSSGEDVRKLQQALIDAGYSVGASGADGIYGANTANAVRQYQQANGLSVDGIYGAKTQAAVQDYQSKNGLSVDGIAGVNTQGKLYGTSGESQQQAAPAPATPT